MLTKIKFSEVFENTENIPKFVFKQSFSHKAVSFGLRLAVSTAGPIYIQ
jgi:hypothetical protein